MKVLLINGSPRKNGNTAAALSAIEKELAAQQIETVSIQVGNQAIRGCMAWRRVPTYIGRVVRIHRRPGK